MAELCKRSLFRFLVEFWDVVIPETPRFNWHMEYMCEELQMLNEFVKNRQPKPYDLIINVPPGSSKSTICSHMYNAWVWTTDPAQRIISASYSHPRALSDAVKTRDIITSPKYQRLFPDVELKADEQAKSNFKTTKGGQRFTCSPTSGVTGEHAHQLLCDDLLNHAQITSKREIETANTFLLNSLSTRKIDVQITPTVLIMQRLHQNDPTGALLASGATVRHICIPATDRRRVSNVSPAHLQAKYVDGLMDPVRLPDIALQQAKTRLGTAAYVGQYEQDPVDEQGGTFRRAWFEIVDWKPEYENLVWNVTADTAYTTDENNDPSAFLSHAKIGADYLIGDLFNERLEFPELLQALTSFAHRNRYTRRSMVTIEPKASGKSLVQTIRRATQLNVKEGEPPVRDKEARAKGIVPTCEAARVKLIRGAWNKEFLDQVCSFPKAGHDDIVDCLTLLVGQEEEQKKSIKIRN